MRQLNQKFLVAAKAAMFNPSTWTPIGEKVPVKDLWAATNPGLFEQVDHVECVLTTFPDGSVAKRLRVYLKNGQNFELKCSLVSTLEVGDLVDVNTIYAQELTKLGQDNIVRFDGEALEA